MLSEMVWSQNCQHTEATLKGSASVSVCEIVCCFGEMDGTYLMGGGRGGALMVDIYFGERVRGAHTV